MNEVIFGAQEAIPLLWSGILRVGRHPMGVVLFLATSGPSLLKAIELFLTGKL